MQRRGVSADVESLSSAVFHRDALSVRGHGFASLCGSRRSRRFSHSCSSVRLPQLHSGLSFNSSSACETLIAETPLVSRKSKGRQPQSG